MNKFNTNPTARSERIPRLVEDLYREMPRIEAARAVLLTESYRATEGEPVIMRRAKAFAHILSHIPIIIREGELIVGSSTLAPRGCQTFPEFSYEWLEGEFDTIAERSADPFFISSLLEGTYHQRTGPFLYGAGGGAGHGGQCVHAGQLFL